MGGYPSLEDAKRCHGTPHQVSPQGCSSPQSDLTQWLWDFDARPIAAVPVEPLKAAERTGRVGFLNSTLYKTDASLQLQPFGTVPAAFSPDGRIGIFASNSMTPRWRERDSNLYGAFPVKQ